MQLRNTVLNLTTEITILRHKFQGLKKAIGEEKQKRKRGKNLFEELRAEQSTAHVFFSPSKVARARALNEERELAKQQEKEQKEARKVERKLKKQKKQLEKDQRALLNRQKKLLQEQAVKKKQRLIQEAKEDQLANQQLRREVQSAKKMPRKPPLKRSPLEIPPVVIQRVEKEVVVISSSGRPQRKRKLPKSLEGYELV